MHIQILVLPTHAIIFEQGYSCILVMIPDPFSIPSNASPVRRTESVILISERSKPMSPT